MGAVEQIRQGAIGDVIGAEVRYCATGIWYRPRTEEMSDAEYQLNRWYHFVWLSGDQLLEQGVHNLDVIHGSQGTCHILGANGGSRIVDRAGKVVWEMRGSIADAYKQEHKALIDSIRAGKPIVELRQMADSSLVGVMGRLAAYTGQKVSWQFVAEESQLALFPKDLTWTSSLPNPGFAVPGKTKLT